MSFANDPKTPDATLSDAYGKLGQVYHAYSLTAAAWDSYVNANLLAPADFRWVYLLAKLDHSHGFARVIINLDRSCGQFSAAPVEDVVMNSRKSGNSHPSWNIFVAFDFLSF